MADKMPIAVLISGRGRTLRNILDKIDANELDVKINLVIGSKNCYGLQFAEKKNIPTDVVESSQYSDIESFSEAVFAKCRRSMARYVVMAGYLSKLRIPQDFENRVLNIHLRQRVLRPQRSRSRAPTGRQGLRMHRPLR